MGLKVRVGVTDSGRDQEGLVPSEDWSNSSLAIFLASVWACQSRATR